ncbi:MAG: flagellar assembly protein FliW [Proteobacteria bacterium]|nr:flagellar assembly protein FliW [Pseudomonadota bacterium]
MESVEFATNRFGRISVPCGSIYRFPGLPGFADAREFAILEHAENSIFGWLVSLEDPDLAFVMSSPWHFFPDYQPGLSRDDLTSVGVERAEDLEVMCLVTVCDGRIHLNLAAPLLLNVSARRGRQIILQGDAYPTRARVPDPPPETTPGGEGGRTGD